MMQLYFSANSPYARKVRVALAERGTPCETIPVDFAKPADSFRAANPNLKVPCLVDGDRSLFESNLILEYLLSAPAPNPTAAASTLPLATSLTRPDHHWDDALLLSVIETLMDAGYNVLAAQRSKIAPETHGAMRSDLARAQVELDWLEARATPEGFVPGVFSIADLNLICTLEWMDFRKPLAWRGRPKLEAIVARYAERPSMAATRPPGP